MDEIKHTKLKVNGIEMHIAELGSGPLVLLLHGFPSIWYSWRHQILFLAKAGYRVVAPDQRGYGQSDVPDGVSEYTALHLVGDLVCLMDTLHEKQAFVIGHDWGSIIASHFAVMRPDLVRGLVNMSVPFFVRHPQFDMLTAMRAAFGDSLYMQRWQKPEEGEAEADVEKHGLKAALTKVYALKGPQIPNAKDGKTILGSFDMPDQLPAWLKNEDIEYCAENFQKSGMTGPFNYYRAIRKSWELMAAWSNVGVKMPSLLIVGDQDMVMHMMPPSEEQLKLIAPNLKGLIVLPDVGHFLAEESPDLVNEHLLKFLKEN